MDRGRKKEQLEELLDASNGSGHENNEDNNFDDDKHCATVSGVSIKERHNGKSTL